MIFHNVVQNSDEWFDLRIGKVTTSNFGKIMANYGKSFGNPAKEYAIKIALEQLTGKRVSDDYSNSWMEHGHEFEPIAKDAYEFETFNIVSNGGFCQHSDFLNVGGSPDGLIQFDNGGIEIKCVKYNTQYKNIKRNSIDPKYRWQKLGNIWLCKLDYLDYITYCDKFPKENKLFIHRVLASDYKEEISIIEPRLMEFEKEIKEAKEIILNNGN